MSEFRGEVPSVLYLLRIQRALFLHDKCCACLISSVRQNKMKHIVVALTLFIASLPCLSEDAAINFERIHKEALEALEKDKKSLLKFERIAIEREKGKEKADVYMQYFEKGMNSKTGAIMIEGGDSQWLEVAYWRGFCYRETYISGYSAREISKK